MHLILCIDERDGLSFCGRRLSQDRVLTEHIQTMTGGRKLWMSPYSAKLFSASNVIADNDFLEKTGIGEYCFVETTPLLPAYENLESVTLYCWNRTYPATVYFQRSLLDGMQLSETLDFTGSSHDKITMERYT